MATLTGRSPKDTYGDLLQVSNANDGVDSTLRFVSDGKGTNSSLKISSASAQFTGTLTTTGLLTTTAGIVSGSNIISDTDSTDDLGSTGVRWLNLWVDNITMGGTIAGAVATFSSTMTVTGLTTATGGIVTSGTIIFEGATADAHETTLTVVDPTGDRTVSLPNATDTLVGKATTDTLTNKTLTSPVLNTGLSGTAFLDEDNMASNSATKAASQQSIKAYVDAQVDTADTLSEVLAIGNTTGGTDVSVSTDDKVQFRDAAIYINSSADGQLDIVADTEIQIAATTIDINGAINASGEIIAGSLDISGDIDVDGTTNLDVVDIDGAVNMAATAVVIGVLSTTAEAVFNGGFASNADSIMGTNKKIKFRDAAIYINSSTDGQLDIVADTEIQIAATTIDINGAVALNGALTGITDITASGVITGGTVEATTDTAAGDNAAMGYTAAEGLILTGQGSSNDVTIKNDADATVMSIATGTTTATFAGEVNVGTTASGDGTLNIIASTGEQSIIEFSDTTNSRGRIYYDHSASPEALVLETTGTTAMTINNSQATTFAGDVSVGNGTITPNGSINDIAITSANSAAGITIGTANNGVGYLAWADTDANNGAWIALDHGTNTFDFRNNSASQLTLSGTVANFQNNDIKTVGEVVIGATGGSSAGIVTVSFDGSPDNGIYLRNTDNGSADQNLMVFDRNGSNTGEIVQSNSGTSYVTSSDYRLKENVVTDWDATTRLKQLKPSRFNFIIDADKTVDGFLAHEVQAIVPEAITGTKDAMTDIVLYVEGDILPEGKSVGDVKKASAPNYQGIDQSKLVPLLVKTIQELEARITALEA